MKKRLEAVLFSFLSAGCTFTVKEDFPEKYQRREEYPLILQDYPLIVPFLVLETRERFQENVQKPRTLTSYSAFLLPENEVSRE